MNHSYIERDYHYQSSRPIHFAIPAFKASYLGHNFSSSDHIVQCSSSRHVGRGGRFGYLCSSNMPTSCMRCLECSDKIKVISYASSPVDG